MHACCCLPGSQHPCLFHTFLLNLIHAQIILSYCGLPLFSQELQPLTCRTVCVPSISIHIWEVVERCDADHAFLECVMLALLWRVCGLHCMAGLRSGVCGALALYKPEARSVGGRHACTHVFLCCSYACFAIFDPLKHRSGSIALHSLHWHHSLRWCRYPALSLL